MLLGIWKNIEELENSISLPELNAILKAAHEKEQAHNRFMAAIQGIDLDKGSGGNTITAKDKVEEMKKRIAAQRAGKSEEEMSLNAMGFEVVVEK